MKKQKKLLLITGAGRSGTKYTANLLRKCGIKVGHEQMREDGVVSGPFVCYKHSGGRIAFSDYQEFGHKSGERPCDYLFKMVWHQTRNPLRAIGSMRDVLSLHVKKWAKVALGQPIGIGKKGDLHWAMNHWYITNRLAEGIAEWRFKVEDIDGPVFDEMLARLDLAPRELPTVAKTMNRSQRTIKVFKPVAEIYAAIQYPTWRELAAVDKPLYKSIRKLARKYGYA